MDHMARRNTSAIMVKGATCLPISEKLAWSWVCNDDNNENNNNNNNNNNNKYVTMRTIRIAYASAPLWMVLSPEDNFTFKELVLAPEDNFTFKEFYFVRDESEAPAEAKY
jgi:hypothetical protein